MTVSPVLTWPPTLEDLLRDIDVAGDDTRDQAELSEVLAAAVAFVERVRSDLNFAHALTGETVTFRLYVRNADGEFENATSAALTVVLPDGTESIESVVNPSDPGHYVHDFASTITGVYTAQWTLTGPAPSGVRKAVDSVEVAALETRNRPDADLKLGTVRLASRWYSRRLTPSALVELGDLGGARIPSFDPDIERMLRIGRHRASVIA